MKTGKRRIYLIIALCILPLAAASLAPFAAYEINRWTLDGGGGNSVGDGYGLSGSIGQADAAVSQGGEYRLQGGFWAGSGQLDTFVYLPVVVKVLESGMANGASGGGVD